MEEKAKGTKTTRLLAPILRIVGWTLLIAFFPIVFFFVNSEIDSLVCSKIVPHVYNDGRSVLITKDGLMSVINRQCPDLIGSQIDNIDFHQIEQKIGKTNIVSRCEAYPTIDGAVHVEIFQRTPIMRVFGSDGSYYMDAYGYKIAATKGMTAHLLIVNGYVNQLMDTDQLVELCNFIYQDAFWRSMIEQVYVTRSREFVLVPRVGDHIIEFGTTEHLDRKFADLKTLYSNGWAKDEWNIYKIVCLKFEGQIVCTKK